ncbi:non-ribosomal peptide synthetase [Streptomyces sp. NPDC086077]|uniref:non-ribosomal peptide synthetase n=1 Tax=Streptomyces sp. NPDC086077 TaxID=3154862 RepID=UPI00342B4BC0
MVATPTIHDGTRTLHGRFERWAVETPGAPAVSTADETLTYQELNDRADELADVLRARGVGPESRVVVGLPRSPALVTALLAVLKAGGAYVPVDPHYPMERQTYMLADSTAMLAITSSERGLSLGATTAVEILTVDEAGRAEHARGASPVAAASAGPLNTAYVIYTSGTTGTPKGVVVEHDSVLDLLQAPQLAVQAGDRVAQFAPTAFDASVFEIWAALCGGGEVVLLQGARLSVEELGSQLREWRPKWMFLTSGLFHLVTAHDVEALRSIDCLITGGDVLSPQHVTRAARQGPGRLYAAYGPTETTVFATLERIESSADHLRVPLGRALVGTRIHVLDDALRPVQQGEIGEIYISGGLARGYHARPVQTATHFIADPFPGRTGARMYRTGDLGSVRTDGSVEFHGRIDRQVKIRGFRIELEEVENLLGSHPEVRQAVVAAIRGAANDKRLVAYVVEAHKGAATPAELRAWLAERLPTHAIPATFVPLQELPLDANGKPDRSHLPNPWTSRESLPGLPEYVAPTTEVEQVIAAAWAETLELDQVGMEDGFFELGGDSLRSVSLLERLRTEGITFTAVEFFSSPNVAALASTIRSRELHRS